MSRSDQIILTADERRAAVLDVIASARTRLCLSMYRCDDRKVLKALGAARRRGVDVNVLLTRRSPDRSNLALLRLVLEGLGATVSRYPSPDVKYHAKYVVVDDTRTLIGSLNFTRKCFKRTSDFLVLSDERDLVRSVAALFEADCAGGALPQGLSPRLIAGPLARQRLVRLIERASTRIQLVDPKLSDPGIRALLAARSESGVRVETVDARQIGSQRSHGKLLVVDDRIAVVGTFALSIGDRDRRREVAVTVEDPANVRLLQTYFRRASSPGMVTVSSRLNEATGPWISRSPEACFPRPQLTSVRSCVRD
jgi:phosphatidylserine/phosphatidylglycerophosphate/cardiolipin synthase-like enzyme